MRQEMRGDTVIALALMAPGAALLAGIVGSLAWQGLVSLRARWRR